MQNLIPEHSNIRAILLGDFSAAASSELFSKITDRDNAFALLMHQPAEFHKIHTEDYEAVFQEALLSASLSMEERHRILYQIIPIVAKHRNGLSFEFLDGHRKAVEEDPQLELDLLLLQIKLKEAQHDLDRQSWELRAKSKPHLAPALLYLTMRDEPKKAWSMLLEWNQKDWKPEASTERHFVSYLFVAVYTFLQNKNNHNAFLKGYDSMKANRLRLLLDETLNRPALRGIKKHLKKLKKGMGEEQPSPVQAGQSEPDFTSLDQINWESPENLQPNYYRSIIDFLIPTLKDLYSKGKDIDAAYGERVAAFLDQIHSHPDVGVKVSAYLSVTHQVQYDAHNARFSNIPISLRSPEKVREIARRAISKETFDLRLEVMLN